MRQTALTFFAIAASVSESGLRQRKTSVFVAVALCNILRVGSFQMIRLLDSIENYLFREKHGCAVALQCSGRKQHLGFTAV